MTGVGSTGLEFLAHLRQLGAELWVEGSALRYRAPKGALSPALLTELSGRKAEIVPLLRSGRFFGPDDRQLFAMYHAPLARDARILTVLCPPLFAEFTRTHALLRRLATDLADKGHHVLRFDYRGTGDSSGSLEEMTLDDWLEDIALTVQEGRRLTGCGSVRLLAVRAAALLACRAAATRDDIERLVLWDPVPDGAGYLAAMHRVQQTVIERNVNMSRAQRSAARHEHEYGGGYRLSQQMVAGLSALDASAYAALAPGKLRIVRTLAASGPAADSGREDVVPVPCQWETDDEDLILAQPLLEKLVACLSGS